MPFRLDQNWQQSLLWWLPVLFWVVLLKYHYSQASTGDLQWMMHPLSDVLSLVTGHHFQRDIAGEWFSIEADVRLVKACAGINFMLMSLLTYAWMLRPDQHQVTQNRHWFAAQLMLLVAVLIAAWATTLLANTLRIWLAMSLQADDSLLQASGIGDRQVHRLIGLLVYLLILSLQMRFCKRISRWQRVLVPVILYLLFLVLVPLLTGNALLQPKVFLEHVLHLLLSLILYGGVVYGLGLKRLWRGFLPVQGG